MTKEVWSDSESAGKLLATLGDRWKATSYTNESVKILEKESVSNEVTSATAVRVLFVSRLIWGAISDWGIQYSANTNYRSIVTIDQRSERAFCHCLEEKQSTRPRETDESIRLRHVSFRQWHLVEISPMVILSVRTVSFFRYIWFLQT